MPAVSNNALGPFTHVRRIDYEEMKRVLDHGGIINVANVPQNSVLVSVLVSVTKPFVGGNAEVTVITSDSVFSTLNLVSNGSQYTSIDSVDSEGAVKIDVNAADASLTSGEFMIGLQILDLQQFAK